MNKSCILYDQSHKKKLLAFKLFFLFFFLSSICFIQEYEELHGCQEIRTYESKDASETYARENVLKYPVGLKGREVRDQFINLR